MSLPPSLIDAISEASSEVNARRPLSEVLSNLAEMARRSLPGIDHVGISITHRDGRIETVAATDDLVLRLDELQYELDEGPCLEAIRTEGVVVINHADRDQRWPRFMERATAMGLRSQMGVCLYADEESLGGLNLYATTADEISRDLEQVAQLFASYAALALGKARTTENLIEGMMTRQRIGVAIGILMHKYELDEDRAFRYLARVSQTSNIKLRQIADEIVDGENQRNAIPDGRPRGQRQL